MVLQRGVISQLYMGPLNVVNWHLEYVKLTLGSLVPKQQDSNLIHFLIWN